MKVQEMEVQYGSGRKADPCGVLVVYEWPSCE